MNYKSQKLFMSPTTQIRFNQFNTDYPQTTKQSISINPNNLDNSIIHGVKGQCRRDSSSFATTYMNKRVRYTLLQSYNILNNNPQFQQYKDQAGDSTQKKILKESPQYFNFNQSEQKRLQTEESYPKQRQKSAESPMSKISRQYKQVSSYQSQVGYNEQSLMKNAILSKNVRTFSTQTSLIPKELRTSIVTTNLDWIKKDIKMYEAAYCQATKRKLNMKNQTSRIPSQSFVQALVCTKLDRQLDKTAQQITNPLDKKQIQKSLRIQLRPKSVDKKNYYLLIGLNDDSDS